MPEVINTARQSSPFDPRRLLGSLLVDGLPRDLANERTSLLSKVIEEADKDLITTDDIRFLKEAVAATPLIDVTSVREEFRRRVVLRTVEAARQGVALPPTAFRAVVAELLELMNAGTKPTAQQAIDLTRAFNTIQLRGLTSTDPLFAVFASVHFDNYIEQCANVLEATLTRGLGYYSATYDIMIGGGYINGNSVYRDVTSAKRVDGEPVKDHTLDVTYTISDCDCDSVEAIQVFFGTPRKDGKHVGTKTITKNGKTYECFVDGGKNSPQVTLGGQPPVYPDKPYYVGKPPDEAGHVDDCKSIRVFDLPSAIVQHEEGYFETAIICINYKK